MSEIQTSVSDKELLDAIKSLLRKNGYLNKFQAEMRTKITEALQDKHKSSSGGPPAPNAEILLILELVMEFLQWSGLLYSAAVLTTEAALPAARVREELCAEVGVRDDERSATLPLLANIVAAYTERVQRKINRSKRDQ